MRALPKRASKICLYVLLEPQICVCSAYTFVRYLSYLLTLFCHSMKTTALPALLYNAKITMRFLTLHAKNMQYFATKNQRKEWMNEDKITAFMYIIVIIMVFMCHFWIGMSRQHIQFDTKFQCEFLLRNNSINSKAAEFFTEK